MSKLELLCSKGADEGDEEEFKPTGRLADNSEKMSVDFDFLCVGVPTLSKLEIKLLLLGLPMEVLGLVVWGVCGVFTEPMTDPSLFLMLVTTEGLFAFTCFGLLKLLGDISEFELLL